MLLGASYASTMARRVLLAPDSFKGSLTAAEAAEAMARGVLASGLEIAPDRCPIADGGEGTLQALASGLGAAVHTVRVTGPLGEPLNAPLCLRENGARAVVEMATAAGLTLVLPEQRSPMRTTSYGVGQLIAEALRAGARRILVGVGGTATNDGGAGLAQALGVRFYDDRGLVTHPITGADLGRLVRVDTIRLDPRLRGVEVLAACDVLAPLLGPEGSSRVYAPQKGATPDQVDELERGLAHLVQIVRPDSALCDRGGAGGGAAFGLGLWCGAELRSGIDLILDAVRFDERVAGCDLVLTGEGRLDGQSLSGKAVVGVARRAAARGVGVVAVCGSLGPGAERALGEGIQAMFSACPGPMMEAEAVERAAELLEASTAQVLLCRFGGRR